MKTQATAVVLLLFVLQAVADETVLTWRTTPDDRQQEVQRGRELLEKIVVKRSLPVENVQDYLGKPIILTLTLKNHREDPRRGKYVYDFFASKELERGELPAETVEVGIRVYFRENMVVLRDKKNTWKTFTLRGTLKRGGISTNTLILEDATLEK